MFGSRCERTFGSWPAVGELIAGILFKESLEKNPLFFFVVICLLTLFARCQQLIILGQIYFGVGDPFQCGPGVKVRSTCNVSSLLLLCSCSVLVCLFVCLFVARVDPSCFYLHCSC